MKLRLITTLNLRFMMNRQRGMVVVGELSILRGGFKDVKKVFVYNRNWNNES